MESLGPGGVSPRTASFGFTQLEFGFLLGPADGRYLVRSELDGPLEAVLILTTLGAAERRRLRGRRGKSVDELEAEPVPTARVSVVRPEPFGSREEAAGWLAELRGDEDAVAAELAAAQQVLNRALAARRAAAADPYAPDVSTARALVARIGYGSGQALTEGRHAEAWELPRGGDRRARRSMAAPDERFAALLGGREQAPLGEEHVLRARADLHAGRTRQAALEARVALEALLAELPDAAALGDHRAAVGDAANAALAGELGTEATAGLEAAVSAMQAALRRRRRPGE